MNKAKKRALILAIVSFVILIGAITADIVINNLYLKQLKYNDVIEKIENKEKFVLLLSQTTCAHCKDFKPKLRSVARKYKLTVYYLETNLLSDKESEELKKHFNFEGTPTTVFVEDGMEATAANRINGDVSKEKIISKFKSNGYIK